MWPRSEGPRYCLSDDETRMLDLDQQIAEMKSRNIPERIATLNQEVKDLQKLIAQLDETALAFWVPLRRLKRRR